jgi:hypothetical protein
VLSHGEAIIARAGILGVLGKFDFFGQILRVGPDLEGLHGRPDFIASLGVLAYSPAAPIPKKPAFEVRAVTEFVTVAGDETVGVTSVGIDVFEEVERFAG